MALIPIRRSVPVKGMNTTVPPRELTEEYAVALENIWYDNGVTLRRRPCQKGISNYSLTAKDIFEYSYRGTTELFAKDAAGAISKITPTSSAPQGQTFAGESSSAMLKNYMVIGDGVANAMKYNGTTWSAISKPPAPVGNAAIGSIFHPHKGRLYAAGNPSFPLTIFVSDTIGTTAAVSGADYWDQGPAGTAGERGYLIDCSGDVEGDKITGLATHRGMLIVFCSRNILVYNIDESNGYNSYLYKVVHGEGCVAHKSIQAVGEDIIFLSQNGFKKLQTSFVQGDSQVNDASQPISSDVRAQILNGAPLSSIRSTYNQRLGLYLCHIDGIVWAYQVMFDGWFKWTGMNGCMFTDSNITTYTANPTTSAALCSLDHKAYQDTLTVGGAGTAIKMIWTPAPFKAQVEHKPRWRRFELIYESQGNDSIGIDYYYDLDVSVMNSGIYQLSPTGVLPNALKSGRFELPIVGRSELISFDVWNDSNSDFRMKIVEVYIIDGGMR